MRSMTGYGRFRQERNGREITIEIKTVNHRFLDLNLRMPRGTLFLEEPLRKALASRLSRGHADVFLTYRNARDDAKEVMVDTSLLHAYAAAFDVMATETGLTDDRSLTRLAALPNVLTVTEKEDDQDAVTALYIDTLHGALDALTLMRDQEGQALASDLATRTGHLEEITEQIGARAPEVVKEYQAKLDARIVQLLAAPPDPQRMAQEVALFADKAAIDEELVRLKSHFTQVRECLAATEPVGRKLDFLVQELNREVNTISSKASDLAIASLVVEAKAEIEKIREQVQNIE